jgi:hypothetical protein
MVQLPTAKPSTLLTNPQFNEHLDELESQDVHRLLVGGDDIRYEIAGATIQDISRYLMQGYNWVRPDQHNASCHWLLLKKNSIRCSGSVYPLQKALI